MPGHEMESSVWSSMEATSCGKENVGAGGLSSPLKPNAKPRGLPTVTPKRFTRFFTPRSSLSGRNSRQSKSARLLKDITNNVVRGQLDEQEFPALRPAKRRRYSNDLRSSPPQSSPIKYATSSPYKQQIEVYEDDSHDYSSCDDEDLLPVSRQARPPTPIRRLNSRATSHQLLTRTFGERCRISQQGTLPYHSTADYCTQPKDSLYLGPPASTLAFCTVPCNTNSLVAIGCEDGNVHLVDTDNNGTFDRPHLTFRVHRNAIMDMAFDPYDSILATASADQTVRIVDMQTREVLSVLAGHKSSVKQIRFRPDDSRLLTTSGRDGLINIWDLRCSQRMVQVLASEPPLEDYLPPTNLSPYASMLAGPAHRATRANDAIIRSQDEMNKALSGVSITSIEHLAGSRGHLLLSSSEQNASLKLWDLRVAGRLTKSDRWGYEMPVSCTPIPATQHRHYGVAALKVSTDGSRVYSICKDNTVWTYSTQHLITGSAPEALNMSRRTRLSLPDKMKEGLGPLYGLRHSQLRISDFYIRAALRKTTPDSDELLAVGSQEQCAILFPTDERHLRSQQSCGPKSIARPSWLAADATDSTVPIYDNVGTALVRGHKKEVTTMAFAHGGQLVTTGDDFRARLWRSDAERARFLRHCGEGEGNRWNCGWADVPTEYDDSDE